MKGFIVMVQPNYGLEGIVLVAFLGFAFSLATAVFGAEGRDPSAGEVFAKQGVYVAPGCEVFVRSYQEEGAYKLLYCVTAKISESRYNVIHNVHYSSPNRDAHRPVETWSTGQVDPHEFDERFEIYDLAAHCGKEVFDDIVAENGVISVTMIVVGAERDALDKESFYTTSPKLLAVFSLPVNATITWKSDGWDARRAELDGRKNGNGQ